MLGICHFNSLDKKVQSFKADLKYVVCLPHSVHRLRSKNLAEPGWQIMGEPDLGEMS